MSFDPGSKLDPSQVQDRRGVSGRTMAFGGGGLGIVGLILGLVLAFGGSSGSAFAANVLNQLNTLNGQQVDGPATASKVASECRTGADAQRKQDCRIVGYVNSIQAYWEKTVRGYGGADGVLQRPHPDGVRPGVVPGGPLLLSG